MAGTGELCTDQICKQVSNNTPSAVGLIPAQITDSDSIVAPNQHLKLSADKKENSLGFNSIAAVDDSSFPTQNNLIRITTRHKMGSRHQTMLTAFAILCLLIPINVYAGRATPVFRKLLDSNAEQAGKDVNEVFTETIPDAATEAADDVADFVDGLFGRKLLDSDAEQAGEDVNDVFTETIPDAATEAADDVADFVDGLFGRKLLDSDAEQAGEDVNEVFTETIPDAATEAADDVADFVDGLFGRKLLDSDAEEAGEDVNEVFTETIPDAATEAADDVADFVDGLFS